MFRPVRQTAAFAVAVLTLFTAGCTVAAPELPNAQDALTQVVPDFPDAPAGEPPAAEPPATEPPAAESSAVAHIHRLLDELPQKGRAPKTGYARDEFGQRWSDDVEVEFGHNGCDTRNDILRRDLTNVEFKPRTRDCVVLTGDLQDPYTGQHIHFERGVKTSSAVQIDHVVALSDAWQKGAQQLDPVARQNFANDPLNLLAVDGSANQQKRDSDAATWLPSNSAFRCIYVARQVVVKNKYGLWVTPAEYGAMYRWLDTCNETHEAALQHLIAPQQG